jgi:hypothetical protein
MYDFIVDGMRYITTELDTDGDLWPEGNGIAEREGMGSEQVDVAVSTWQALRALTRMAQARGDTANAACARQKADALEAAFDDAWWVPAEALYADSLCNADDLVAERDRAEKGWTNVCVAPNQQLTQRIWVSVIPMETTLAPAKRAHMALDTLETPAFSGTCGLYLVGEAGGPDGKAMKKCWTVMAGVMALAEANYGRLGAEQAMLSVVPQIPPSWPGLAARRLHMGMSSIAVSTEKGDGVYRTVVEAPEGLLLTIGHTLATETEVASVTLDGAPTGYALVETIRGREVRVETTTGVMRTLVVTTGEA